MVGDWELGDFVKKGEDEEAAISATLALVL